MSKVRRASSAKSAHKAGDEIFIAVMGAQGSGKTTFINLVSGSDLLVGHGLKSCTTSVEGSKTFKLFGRWITLIDIPGFGDATQSDSAILKSIAGFLANMYESIHAVIEGTFLHSLSLSSRNRYKDGYKLTGVLYLHRISDPKVTANGRRDISVFKKLCGDEMLRNVVVVTTMWDRALLKKGIAREHELTSDSELFRPILAHGAVTARHDNTLESAQAVLLHLVNKCPEVMKIQKEIVDEHKGVIQTQAGIEVGGEQVRYRDKLAQVQRDMEGIILRKDMEAKKAIEGAREEFTVSMQKLEKDLERVSSEGAEEKRHADQQINELTNTLEAEEQTSAQRQVDIERLEEMLRDKEEAFAAERNALQQQINELCSSLSCVIC